MKIDTVADRTSEETTAARRIVHLRRGGTSVIVDLDATEVRRGDRVALRTRTGETLAKEIATMNVREVVLASMNPDYPPRHLARDQILWMARILWVSQ